MSSTYAEDSAVQVDSTWLIHYNFLGSVSFIVLSGAARSQEPKVALLAKQMWRFCRRSGSKMHYLVPPGLPNWDGMCPYETLQKGEEGR